MKGLKYLSEIMFFVFWYAFLIMVTTIFLHSETEDKTFILFPAIFYLFPLLFLIGPTISAVSTHKLKKGTGFVGKVTNVETFCPPDNPQKHACTSRVTAVVILPTTEDLIVYSKFYSGTQANCAVEKGDSVYLTMNEKGEFSFAETPNGSSPAKYIEGTQGHKVTSKNHRLSP